MANNFNEFFTSVGSNTVKKIQSLAKENNYHPSTFVPDSYPESEQFSFEPVESSLVGYVVRSMPDNKAPGTDKITISRIVRPSSHHGLLLSSTIRLRTIFFQLLGKSPKLFLFIKTVIMSNLITTDLFPCYQCFPKYASGLHLIN